MDEHDNNEYIGQDKSCEFAGIKRSQDYAQILFNLSRVNNTEEKALVFTAMVARDWCGDVARYITDLENSVKRIELE